MEEMKKTPDQSGMQDMAQEALQEQDALFADILSNLPSENSSEESALIDQILAEHGNDVPDIPGTEPESIPEALPEIITETEELSEVADTSEPAPVADAEEGAPLLHAPELREEITADDHAMDSHDLTHPSEMEEPAADEGFRAEGTDDGEFNAMFSGEATGSEVAASDKQRPVRKGRPKRKKGVGLLGIPHLLATVIWLMIIVAIGTSLGRMIWVYAADALAFGRESKKVTVTITSSDTNEDIADKLHKAGLIRYPGLFELYAGLAVDEGEIVPGTYELDTIYDYMALVVQMSNRSSSRETLEVLIPEGLNCRQIFELLEEKKICTVAELEEYAASGELEEYWFLEGVERGDKYCLEGFLFPDTYEFYVGSSARHALEKMLSGFEYRYTEEIHGQLVTLNERLSEMMRNKGCSEEYIAGHQLSLRDMITVASLIEEETASVTESATIASVIYNRLTEDQEYERYLGIDATIIYALGEHKEELTAEDLAIDSPYNTRLYAGLVPGPISNPGLDSIKAALDPADSDFYYYVLDPDSHLHDFSKTYEEHEEKVEKYRGEG